MAIRTELHLGIQNFKANLKRSTQEVRKEAGIMKREAAGVGDKLASGLEGAKTRVGAALSFGAILAGVKEALRGAQELSNLSVALNESVESLNRVSYAAGALGVDFMTVAELGRELEDRLGDLGNAEPVEVMNRLGLSIEELMAMPLDQKLLTIAGAFEKARGDGTAYSDLLKLLGDSVGEQLLPLLGQGKEALEAMFSDAPAMSEEMVNSMARMNEEINKGSEGLKRFGGRYIGSILGVGQVLKDALAEGSIDEALLMEGNRQVEFAQRQAGNAGMADAKAKAIANAREAEAATAAEAKEAEKLRSELEKLVDLKEKLSEKEIAILPPEGQISALKGKLEDLFSGSIQNFPNFDRSTAGLKALAESRDKTTGLPADGTNSALEAWTWYQEALEISEKQRQLETSIAKEEADKAKKRADDLQKARDESEAGGFALLSPEEQAAKLKEQLGDALGIDVRSMGDVDSALASQRKAVADARAASDATAEQAALDKLNESQRLAQEFASAADGLAPEAPAGGVGSLGQLVNQIFGRDPQAQQLDELKRATDLARDQRDRLDIVITKMDEQPPVVRFERF